MPLYFPWIHLLSKEHCAYQASVSQTLADRETYNSFQWPVGQSGPQNTSTTNTTYFWAPTALVQSVPETAKSVAGSAVYQQILQDQERLVSKEKTYVNCLCAYFISPFFLIYRFYNLYFFLHLVTPLLPWHYLQYPSSRLQNAKCLNFNWYQLMCRTLKKKDHFCQERSQHSAKNQLKSVTRITWRR